MVLSHELFNNRSGTVIAMAITSKTQSAGFPLTLELPAHRLPKRSWVKISQIRTISVERLGKRIGRIEAKEMDQLIEGLFELVG